MWPVLPCTQWIEMGLEESVLCLADTPTSSDCPEGQKTLPSQRHEDTELTSWLRLYGADQDSIERVRPCREADQTDVCLSLSGSCFRISHFE